EVERRAGDLVGVLGRGLLLAELALDPVHAARPALDPVEQRASRQSVVRVLVVGRDAAFVSPPEVDLAPVALALRGLDVRLLRRLAAGEDDALADARCAGEALGHHGRNDLLVVDDDELDVVHCSPAASSRLRSIAAWIALRKAARTPACSSSRIARIVVPPGEVTASLSSTGWIPSSRSSFAVPSIVWTTSCVDVSRPSPSRMPASIIASASSAKYAGPEPDTAVTASMYVSGTRATAPRCESTSSARSRCSSPACAPAHTPAIPSCTSAGAFGIARTTGTPFARRASICDVGIAAATESTVCSGVINPPTSPSRTSKSCGFTAITIKPASPTALALSSVPSTPWRSFSSASRSSRRPVTTMSPGLRHPELSSPASSDSPIFPAPRIVMLRLAALAAQSSAAPYGARVASWRKTKRASSPAGYAASASCVAAIATGAARSSG